MKLQQLLEAAARKISAQERNASRNDIAGDIQNIFKWETSLSEDPFNGIVTIRMNVPADEEPDDIEFKIKMLIKKLPSIFKKRRAAEITVGEPRIMSPSTKSVRFDSGAVHTMRKGPKTAIIRVSLS